MLIVVILKGLLGDLMREGIELIGQFRQFEHIYRQDIFEYDEYNYIKHSQVSRMESKQKYEVEQLLLEQSEESQYHNNQEDPHAFSSNFQFLISTIGATAGFGSFWRFPYLVYKNGGGAFFVPYLFALLIIGIPILYLQLSLGQMHQVTVPFIFNKIHPAFKIVGLIIILNNLHLAMIYNVLMVYSYRLIFSAFNPNLPFSTQSITENIYFEQTVLQKSASIEEFQAINPTIFVIYVLSLVVCYFIIKNGVKASQKIINFTAISPFVILLILMVRGLFLDGATEGIKYLFEPKWERLSDVDIWVDAFVQVFYQLSLGIGMLMCFSSMNSRKQKITFNAIAIPFSNLICGLISSVTIFLFLSHFCKLEGITIDNPNLKLYGPDLSFNIFPKALATLPLPNLWIFIFFSCMVFLGIDSLFAMIETIYCYLRDQFKDGPIEIMGIDLSYQTSKRLVLCIFILVCPTLSSHAGIYYVQFYDYYSGNIPFALCVVIQLYAFVDLFKFSQLENKIIKHTGQKPNIIIKFILEKRISLVVVGLMLLLAICKQIMSFRRFPFQFYIFGWIITLYPYLIAYLYFKSRWTKWQDIKTTFQQIQDRPSYL